MKEKICIIENCQNNIVAKGFCNKHYLRFKKYGDPLHSQHKTGCLIDGCVRKHSALGYCATHHRRIMRHGDPNYMSRKEPKFGTLKERFDKSYIVNKATGCWEWDCQLFSTGYGKIEYNDEIGKRKCTPAHRLSYRLYKGEIKDALQVCHKCDNRKCVNPEHLWLGTQKDNVLDMLQKGRHISGWSGKFRRGK